MFKIFSCFLIFCPALAWAEVNINEIDKLIYQWSQLEQQYNEIDLDWREKKPILKQQLKLLKEEKLQLQNLLDEHTSQSGEVAQKRIDLLTEQTSLEKIQAQMNIELMQITKLVLNMHKRLPPPIQSKWNSDDTSLTKKNQAKINNSERLEKLLQMLDSISRFEERPALHQTTMTVSRLVKENSDISVTDLKNNDQMIEIEVDQFYLGISQGWYISKNGDYWGSGNSSSTGWQWHQQALEVDVNELKETIRILRDPALASIVTLPAKLTTSEQKIIGKL
jgi:septal ring factor EnvC (AmiA/AmiB activator)